MHVYTHLVCGLFSRMLASLIHRQACEENGVDLPEGNLQQGLSSQQA